MIPSIFCCLCLYLYYCLFYVYPYSLSLYHSVFSLPITSFPQFLPTNIHIYSRTYTLYHSCSYPIMLYHILLHPILSYPIILYHMISYYILSYVILSYPISFLILLLILFFPKLLDSHQCHNPKE